MSILKVSRRGGKVRKIVDPGTVTVKSRLRLFGFHDVSPNKDLLDAVRAEWTGSGNAAIEGSVYPSSFAPVIDGVIYKLFK